MLHPVYYACITLLLLLCTQYSHYRITRHGVTSLYTCCSAHGGNTVDRGRHAPVGVGRYLAGVLQELEVRTGTGQPAVEGRLQRHRDQRHGEQQHVFQDIPSELRGDDGGR